MKTLEAAPAANITARELARSLTKPATPPKTETETATESTEASRELPKDEPESTDLSQTKTSEAETGENPTAESAETPPPETTEETEATEATAEETTEPAKAELPAELRDAMEIAKGDGKKGVAQLLKRVHSLTDARDTERNGRLTAEEQLKQLRGELAEAKKAGGDAGAPRDNGPMHPEVRAAVEELQAADNWLGWCDANPEGGEVPDGKGGTVALDEKAVNALRRQLERNRQELVANKVAKEREVRDAYTAQYQTQHATAVREYPWVTKPEAPEHQEMQAILKVAPWFKQMPDYEMAIGHFLTGKRLYETKAKARTAAPAARKATPSREPTKVVTTPPGGGARQATGNEEVEAAEAQFKKTGKTADFAKWQAAKAKQRRMGK